MPLNNVDRQQMAVASNLSSTESLNQLLRKESDKRTDKNEEQRLDEKNLLQKALDGKGDSGTQILAKLAAKLSQNMPTARILNNLKEEYGSILEQPEEAFLDQIDIKDPFKSAKANKQNKSASPIVAEKEGNLSRDPVSIREYIETYSQVLLGGGTELKKKADKLEKQLIEEKSFPLKDLQSIKTQVATSIRSNILRQIKNSYLKQILTKGKSLEEIIARKETNKFIDFAFLNEKIGGYDFGGQEGNLQGAVDRGVTEVHEQLKDFVKDSLTEQVVKRTVTEEKGNLEKDIESLLKLGQKIGFDVKEFVDKLPQVRSDLGLDPFIDFNNQTAGANSENGGGPKHGYQYSAEEEKDIYTEKLRAMYLRRAVYGDARTILETHFKMIKLKNGLIRLGVKNFDEIEEEGHALARVKLVEMLKDGFEERATYASLSGEAWKITEKKIKTVLRNLEKLGIKLSTLELDQIRDQANKKMLQVAEYELNLLNTALESRGEVTFLTSKRKMIQDIINRITEESGLSSKLKADVNFSIKEAC